MPAVENYMKIDSMKKNIEVDNAEYNKFACANEQAKDEKLLKISKILNDFNEEKVGKRKKNAYLSKNVALKVCRGFLSSAWKCGLCETWTCPKCFDVLGKEKECGHECDPNNVESAKLIKKETRNCPSCAIPIFKIEGCDQMWCTQCHIAFSWKSGLRVNGVVHNPHFYQWQRAGGGAAPIQTPGAQACGGLPGLWQFSTTIKQRNDRWTLISPMKLVQKLLSCIRGVVIFNIGN